MRGWHPAILRHRCGLQGPLMPPKLFDCWVRRRCNRVAFFANGGGDGLHIKTVANVRDGGYVRRFSSCSRGRCPERERYVQNRLAPADRPASPKKKPGCLEIWRCVVGFMSPDPTRLRVELQAMARKGPSGTEARIAEIRRRGLSLPDRKKAGAAPAFHRRCSRLRVVRRFFNELAFSLG